MIRKEIYLEKEHAQGGKGTVYNYCIASEEELLGAARLYARVVVPPGASIGIHTHTGETEPYYILKGEGMFTEPDGSVVKVVPGDCCIIEPGQSHGIENQGTEDLEFMALIYFDHSEK